MSKVVGKDIWYTLDLMSNLFNEGFPSKELNVNPIICWIIIFLEYLTLMRKIISANMWSYIKFTNVGNMKYYGYTFFHIFI